MRKIKGGVLSALLWISGFITIALLVTILGYIFIKGMPLINYNFIFGKYSFETGGIWPMIVTTVYIVVISLIIATPIGIFAAVYLQEYAKQGPLVKIIRFSTECLTGIPSIIYGLFGALFFVVSLKLKYSVLSGALTLTIVVLPVIIRTTEEALKTVPMSFREGSLGLGATKFQTLYKIIIPNALPGVLGGVILSIGRIVGESAAVYLTAGTMANLPKTILNSGRTLTVHAFMVAQEKGNIEMACAIGIVLIAIILFLNITAKLLTKKFRKQ